MDVLNSCITTLSEAYIGRDKPWAATLSVDDEDLSSDADQRRHGPGGEPSEPLGRQDPGVAGERLKVGEHTREILAEHGYARERIDGLLARKIVFDAAFVDAGNAQAGVKVPAE